MPLSLTRARQLCTKQELELVAWARPVAMKELTPARLRGKIDRARKLRDKFRGLETRQVREARGKQPPRGASPAQGHARTTEKADLFADVLARFEERAAKLARDEALAEQKAESARDRAAAKKTAARESSARATPKRASKPGARKLAAKKKVKPAAAARKKATASKLTAKISKASSRARQKTESSLAARKARKVAAKPDTRVRAHVSATGRRNQARRDSR